MPSWPSTALGERRGIQALRAVDDDVPQREDRREHRAEHQHDRARTTTPSAPSQPRRRRRARRVKRRTSARSSRLRRRSAAENSARAVRERAGWGPCRGGRGGARRAVRRRDSGFGGRSSTAASPGVPASARARLPVEPAPAASLVRDGSRRLQGAEDLRDDPGGSVPGCDSSASAPRSCGTMRYTSPQLRVMTRSPSRATSAT